MAIRIRRSTLNGTMVALCAVESDEQVESDLYLDDGIHAVLAAKFALDWQGQTINWQYPEIWEAMEAEKVRDAVEVCKAWEVEARKWYLIEFGTSWFWFTLHIPRLVKFRDYLSIWTTLPTESAP